MFVRSGVVFFTPLHGHCVYCWSVCAVSSQQFSLISLTKGLRRRPDFHPNWTIFSVESHQKCLLSAASAALCRPAGSMLISVSACVFIPPSTRPCLPPASLKIFSFDGASIFSLWFNQWQQWRHHDSAERTLTSGGRGWQRKEQRNVHGWEERCERGRPKKWQNERDASNIRKCRGECETGQGLHLRMEMCIRRRNKRREWNGQGGEGIKELVKMQKCRESEDRRKEVWRWVQRDDGSGREEEEAEWEHKWLNYRAEEQCEIWQSGLEGDK